MNTKFDAHMNRNGRVLTLTLECEDDYAAMFLYDRIARDRQMTFHITTVEYDSTAPLKNVK